MAIPLLRIGIPRTDKEPIVIQKRDHKPRPSSLTEVKDLVFAAVLQGKVVYAVPTGSGIDIIKVYDPEDIRTEKDLVEGKG